MSDASLELSQAIRELAAALPYELAETMALAMLEYDGTEIALNRTRVLSQVSNPNLRARISRMFDLATLQPQMTPVALGLALATAAKSEHAARLAPQLELVWTGPTSRAIPLRRTEQTFLQLIHEASERLLIVSFAVYKIPSIANALATVVAKGVQLTLCLESANVSEGKIAYDTLKAFNPQVAQRATLLFWPLEKRDKNDDGKFGSLHAKVAIADGKTMFLSSANLTDYAMNLNMELGVVIRGSALPALVEKHFQELKGQGTLVPMKDVLG
ncbi:MAG TPA: DISARM system phospholipase D-like protein DrmC [Anaerolineae bacterium]|nr:DISARM system phospholipase D-like protein DrmC [Anaerolineae bacterium]